MTFRSALTPAIAERFWAKVDRRGPHECWPWTAGVQNRGYGQFGVAHGHVEGAHRIAYQLARGPIPTGLTVDHLCNVRRCQNPDHLELVPRSVNTRRRWERNPQTHCALGHALTPDNIMVEPSSGFRRCRTCRRANNRVRFARWRARHKADVAPTTVRGTSG